MIRLKVSARPMRNVLNVFIILMLAATVQSCRCSSADSPKGATAEVTPEAKLISRGKAIYMSNCIACHNSNPKLAGSQGPDVHGSSKELLTARLLHAKYPDGYKPKRESAIMPALPHLGPEIDALTAYLNAQ